MSSAAHLDARTELRGHEWATARELGLEQHGKPLLALILAATGEEACHPASHWRRRLHRYA